jgi:hypothetical protein
MEDIRMNDIRTALWLYAWLAAGILALAAWLIYKIISAGSVQVDMVAFLTVLFMAFRDVISKMGDCVRAINKQAIPERTLDLTEEVP